MAGTKPGKPRGNPAWVPGGPSPNPGGRPRSATAFVDAVRRKVDPERLIERALAIVEAEDTTDKDRIAAMAFLHGAGYVKPAERHEVAAVAAQPDDEDLAGLTLDQLDELDALERAHEDARAAILTRAQRTLPSGAS